MIQEITAELNSQRLPVWIAVCISTMLLCLGQFGWIEGWPAIICLNTGGIGLISCLGLSEIRRRIDEQEIARLKEVSTTDALTGAGNRRAFDQEMSRRLTQFRRYGTPCSLLVIDVDHFKSVNDTWGHDVGDQVLVALARSISATLRDIDLLFRIGGEEFAALLPETQGKNAVIAAERVREAVNETQIPAGKLRIQVTASVGGAQLLPNDNVESWFKRADIELFDAKQGGRNRVAFKFSFNPLPEPSDNSEHPSSH